MTNTTTALLAKLHESFESVLAAEEDRYAAQGIRTVRVVDGLHIEASAPMVVIESHTPEHKTWCTTFDNLGADHPARSATPGDSYSYQTRDVRDGRRRILHEQTFIGTFEPLAHLRHPVTSVRVSLLAEIKPS